MYVIWLIWIFNPVKMRVPSFRVARVRGFEDRTRQGYRHGIPPPRNRYPSVLELAIPTGPVLLLRNIIYGGRFILWSE
jgi:hypothetical protein